MTTRRSTKTTTRRAERKCSSSSSSSAFCDACVYIIKSLTEVLFNNNRGNSVTKQISLVVLSRPSVRSRGAAFKKFEARNCPNLHQISLSFASKSDWWFCLSINPPFFRKSASNLNQNILLLCISYITEEISDKGRGQKMSTRHLDYDPDRRARESGREEAEVLDARRLVYVEPWYRKLWRWIHFF